VQVSQLSGAGFARRKTCLAQNGRSSLRVSPRDCARVVVCRFGQVPAARRQREVIE